MIKEHTRFIDILYVEDDESDAEIALEALGSLVETPVDLHVVQDGEEAVKYLHRTGRYAGAPRPDLILLDLNLPKVNGKQVLRAVKSARGLRRIPVVVLSTSLAQEDVDESYELGAAGFITKPLVFDEYRALFRRLFDYWGNQVQLPSKVAR